MQNISAFINTNKNLEDTMEEKMPCIITKKRK